MANVFISHASTDHEPTRRVRDLIRGGGHEVVTGHVTAT
jgi:hypothetical protein